MAAEWLTHSSATLDVTGSRLKVVYQRFISRIDTVSGTEGLEMVCVALGDLTVTCYVSFDKYQTKQ